MIIQEIVRSVSNLLTAGSIRFNVKTWTNGILKNLGMKSLQCSETNQFLMYYIWKNDNNINNVSNKNT